MAQTFVTGGKIVLTRKLSPGDTSLYADRDLAIDKGRLYFVNADQVEWLSFDAVAASGSEYVYSGLVRQLSQTAEPATTTGTGYTWLAASEAKLVAMHDQLNDINEPTQNIQVAKTYATEAARDAALGGNGVAAYDYTDIKVVSTGLFYNYNLTSGQWEVQWTGTATPNASTTVSGSVEIATQTEVTNSTDTGGTGAKVVVIPSTFQTGVSARLATERTYYNKFIGTGADGVQGDADLTITGSDNTIITKEFTSWTAGSVARTATITPTGCITLIKIQGDADFTNWTFNWSGKGMAGGTGGAGNTNPNTSGQGGAVGNVSTASALTFSSTVPTGGVAGNNNANANSTGAGGGGSGGWSGANILNNGANGSAGTGGGAQGAGGTAGSYTNRLLSMLSIQPMKHIPILVPQWGSGGQGGGAGATNGGTSVTGGIGGTGGTGGAGGGVLIIQVGWNLTLGNVSFNLSGTNSTGWVGGNASAGGANAGAGGGGGGGGGGGAGGFLCVFYNGTLTGSTTPNVAGGTSTGWTGGTGVNGGPSGTTGSAGGTGATGGYIIEKNIAF